MTDLTEQWKKGKLVEGKKYYCESKYIADMFKAECHNKGQNDEWWTLKNGKYCFNNVYHKNDIKVLALVPSYEETTKLKELLKECKGSIATLLSKRITEVNSIKQKELLTKINQALGEDK